MMDSDEEPTGPQVFAKRRRKQINRKTKIQVVFDEKSRRDFLTGFHKRKQERKKKAQDELKQQLKEEKKRIRLESKEQYKKMTKTFQPIPELEEKLAQHHEVKNATVSILELDTDLLAENNFIIGRNRVRYDGIDDENEEEIEPKKEIKEDTSWYERDETITKEEPEKEPKTKKIEKELKTKKELNKEIKKKATKIMKKSAAFKKLNKQEQIKQKKKSRKIRELKQKKIEKQNKKKKKRRVPEN